MGREIYDAMLMNMDVFCEDGGESEAGRLPEMHTEAGYKVSDDSKAVEPCTEKLR